MERERKFRGHDQCLNGLKIKIPIDLITRTISDTSSPLKFTSKRQLHLVIKSTVFPLECNAISKLI